VKRFGAGLSMAKIADSSSGVSVLMVSVYTGGDGRVKS
jgi:hypothetical protein